MQRSSGRIPHPRGARLFLAVFLGTWLVQLAWAVALPTFAGPDEFDHAYKADAVAGGQLRGTEPAPEGRGDLVAVRPGVLTAAAGVCRGYGYTLPDDCRAVSRYSGPAPSADRVLVASAAASYNPVYYVVAGTIARAWDGPGFDLALRLVTLTACSALLAAAVTAAAGRARTAWPLLALAVAVTPQLLYSGAVAAPNGVGYAAACLWWVAALSIVDDRRPMWGALAAASVLVLVTHTMNVVWLPLLTLAVLLLRPLGWWRERLGRRRPVVVVTVVATTALGCVGWILTAGTNRLGSPADDAPPLLLQDLLGNQVAWALQTVAAFPLRNDADNPGVYAAWLLALAVVLVLGWRAGGGRERVSGTALLAVWVAVPIVLTLVSYSRAGFSWQGRYAFPVAMGLVLLAGRALERRPARTRPLVPVLSVLLALTHCWCVVALAARQSDATSSWSLARQASPSLAVAVVAVLVVLGAAVVLLALHRGPGATRTGRLTVGTGA